MTDQEKKDNPTHKTTGGYIKTISLKEAWASFWETTTEENRKKILRLPNFSLEIFTEITGISPKSDKEQKAKELRAKAEELLKAVAELENSL